MHRKASYRWLLNIDLQLRTSTALPGLSWLIYTPSLQTWAASNWRAWPYAMFNMDQGSDGLTGENALEYHFSANCDRSNDICHGGNRDWVLVLKENKIYFFWVSMAISWNLPFGYKRDHVRKFELWESLVQLYKTHEPDETPLFLEYSHDIIEALKKLDYDFPHGMNEVHLAWGYLRDRPFAHPTLYRMTMCRFLSSHKTAEYFAPWWHIDKFERTWLALESDAFAKVKTSKVVAKLGDAEAVGEHSGSTDAKQFTVHDRLEVHACDNAVAHSALMLFPTSHLRLVKCVTEATRPLPDFTGNAARMCRDSSGTEEWVKDMADLGIVAHLVSFMMAPYNLKLLQEAMFILVDNPLIPEEAITEEDEFAAVLGKTSVGMTAARGRRLLNMLGWPFRWMKCLADEAYCEPTVTEYKRDYENFKELETVVKHPLGSLKCLQLLYTRSRFHKVSVKQFHAGLVEEGFVMSPDLLKLASWRARLMGQSVPVEEMIGHVKNSKIANGTTKFRRPDLMMYRAIVGNSFADSRLRYSMPSMEAPVLTKRSRLPSESYRSCKKTASVDVSDMVSTRPSPHWYSPSATNQNDADADTFFIEELRNLGTWDYAETAWLGEIVECKNLVIFRMKRPGADGGWKLGLTHFSGSTVMVWPGELQRIPGSPGHHFLPDLLVNKIHFAAVCEIGERTECFKVEWRSWLWQLRRIKGLPKSWSPACRLFTVGQKAKTILEVCADYAFFDLTFAFCKNLANLEGMAVTGDKGNFPSLLFDMIKHVTKRSNPEVLERLRMRIAANDLSSALMPTLLGLDEPWRSWTPGTRRKFVRTRSGQHPP